MKTEKRAREQQRRNKTLESRRQLSSVRVVQKNLVFVVGLPVRLADPEVRIYRTSFINFSSNHLFSTRFSTGFKKARVFWKIWQNSQSSYKS